MYTFELLKQYPLKNYAIIERSTLIEPFVACYGFDKVTGSWQQGHYFETLEQATQYVESL